MARAFYFVFLAAFAIAVIGVQLDRQAYGDLQAANLVPGPFRGVSQQRLLEVSARQEPPPAMLRPARDLVRKRPLPARHLLLFARAAEQEGDRGRAIAAIELAAARGWREPGPQLAVVQAAMLAGNHPAAAQRLAALVATGAATDETDLLIAAMLAEEGGREALADLLTGEGNWKRYFVQRLAAAGSDEEIAETIAMAWDRGAVLDCVQVRPLAERYLGEGRDDLASSIWRGDCANETLTAD